MSTESEASEGSASNLSSYKIGDWLLNAHSNQLTKDGRSVELEYRLMNLLVFLLENRDRVLAKDEILRAVWPKKVVNDDSVAVAISQLRKALEDNPRAPTYIKTIPGVGYQFIHQDQIDIPVANSTVEASEPAKVVRPIKTYAAVAGLMMCLGMFAVLIYTRETAKPLAPMPKESPVSPTHNANLFTQAAGLTASPNAEDWRTAVKLLRQFIQENPTNAPAYLNLAETKIKLFADRFAETENYLELTALLNKALELDPDLARAHAWLAELIFVHDLNPAKAEKHFKLAVALAPRDDFVHYRYAHFLFIYKRFSEAQEQINISRGLNPLSFSGTNMVWIYLLQGNNELAERELERIQSTEEVDKYFKIAAQNVYYQMGNEQKVYENMQWFFKRAQFNEEKINVLNQAFSEGGLKAVYRWLLEHKETADVGQYTPPISWARYAIAVGDNKSAMNYLEQAFAKRQPHVECAVADPHYAPLKDEVKFKEFVARFGSSVTR
ncbi:hypothetical protein GCM10011613_00350 [Cellvibrio zantedeschiae]|uniref:OmpR/PhoB-type domain-containing protein n=1 Tax=Cellvibrio zantedeschiae TaxID=1237077 RepID=A0ABQ3AMS8_9GAMM|nr:winged helix-turn-helix domain-containing protein [Cellvibrio zantedeschiae]GGY60962.1 hypothetical protein GCM10011613_00350 [Cellvibrio zantedeschiae]